MPDVFLPCLNKGDDDDDDDSVVIAINQKIVTFNIILLRDARKFVHWVGNHFELLATIFSS